MPGATLRRGQPTAVVAGEPPEKAGRTSTSRTLPACLYLVLLGGEVVVVVVVAEWKNRVVLEEYHIFNVAIPR